jgi:hypothetical protein
VNRAALQTLFLLVEQAEDESEYEAENEIEFAVIEDPFLPLLLTVLATLQALARLLAMLTLLVQYLRADQKRTSIAKALEAEKPAKRDGCKSAKSAGLAGRS